MKVLICDDEANIRNLMKRFLASEKIDSDGAENGLSAQRLLESGHYDALLVDLRMPGMDGLSLIRWVRDKGLHIPTIMISAHGEIRDAVSAMKYGAEDYIEKPFEPEELVERIKSLVEADSIRNVAENDVPSSGFIGESPEILRIKAIIEKIAPSQANVLITGESGTGKEVVAKEIHLLSSVSDGPFMAINIGGVPENLIESELFGYERGAFTGADQRKQGLFELASGGTLFLDEIGDMPLSLQVKILRVLQERRMTRLGGTVSIPIDARIVAATNKDLERMVAEGTFREDLFYRLNVVRISIPPLRERVEDIPLLAGRVIRKYNLMMGMKIMGLTPEALNALKAHPFYGNVRELENIIERAMIFAASEVIDFNDLDLGGAIPREMPQQQAVASEETLSLRDIERNAIIRALHRWEGNRTRTAEELGISRRTLISKIQEYGIDL